MLPQGLSLAQTQNTWATAIDPVLNFAPNQGILLKNIKLAVGANNINHLLSRMQQGWMLTDVDAPAKIYRSQPFNKLTLTLTTDVATTVNIWVF